MYIYMCSICIYILDLYTYYIHINMCIYMYNAVHISIVVTLMVCYTRTG